MDPILIRAEEAGKLLGLGLLAAASAGNGLDLEALRLSQDFSATLGVKKALLTVPVRKPDRQ